LHKTSVERQLAAVHNVEKCNAATVTK